MSNEQLSWLLRFVVDLENEVYEAFEMMESDNWHDAENARKEALCDY